MAQLVRPALARRASTIDPVVKGACHGLVSVCACVAIARELGAVAIAAAIAIGAYVVGVSEVARRRRRRLAVSGLVIGPIVIALGVAHRSLAAATLAVALLGVVARALRLARGRDPERATVLLLAGMSLVDAALLGAAGHAALAVVAAAAPVAMGAVHHLVRGTPGP